jgi:nucleoside-diphosphate-sugar epimerase
LHISDAVRAIAAAAYVRDYTVINIGHPDVVPIETLAQRIRARVGAPESLVKVVDLPSRMTLVKRPLLTRQRDLLGVTPTVPLEDGILRVCDRIRARVATSPIGVV